MEYFTQYLPFLFLAFLIILLMISAHKSTDSKFFYYDLLCNTKTGKAAVEKILLLIAGLAITLWFMQTAANGKVTVNEVIAYGGVMGLAKFARDMISLNSDKKKPDAVQQETSQP